MTKILVIAGIIVIGILAVSGWYFKQQYDAEQRGIEKQINLNVAKANQKIAERRTWDADFDKNDVRIICERDGFEWVYENNRSFCR